MTKRYVALAPRKVIIIGSKIKKCQRCVKKSKMLFYDSNIHRKYKYKKICSSCLEELSLKSDNLIYKFQ